MEGRRVLLEQLEGQAREGAGADIRAALCYVAALELGIADEESRPAARRALLVHAAGGDATRDPQPHDPAVARFASDLGGPERQQRLADALRTLASEAADLARVSGELAGLTADPPGAWRLAAAALFAEQLLEAD